MVYEILQQLSVFITQAISLFGYWGVFVLMALESACLPIPSEIIMPFAGFLVLSGKFSIFQVVLWGTLGNLAGSIVAYFAGFYGGRPLVEKYGKYVLISRQDLDLAQKWFEKYGSLGIFFSRLLPIVRTFISLPAGIAKMPFWKFCFFTFLGSLPWALFLTYIGVIMGENWKGLEIFFRRFDWVVGIMVVAGAGWWIYKKIK